MERQGFSSDLDVESRFWWEPHLTAFEERLPLPLRHTYQYFDVAATIPKRLNSGDFAT